MTEKISLKMMVVLLLAVLLTGFITTTAGAEEKDFTEYFVARQGDDGNDGRSKESPFATIQRGVDALEPGDTLTIGPGEYREAVERDDLGSMDEQTTIRAGIPGTVLLRGDVPAPQFEPVDGYRYVYMTEFDRPVQAVSEVDTLSALEIVPNINELEFNPGHAHYDEGAGKLYISTTDMRPPEEHLYTVAVVKSRGGIFFNRPRRVVIDGLAATGFHRQDHLTRLRDGNSASDQNPWGIFLARARECVIRNSTAYLNAGGIAVRSHSDREEGGDNLIENCRVYGNSPRHGLAVYMPHKDTIRHSAAFLNGRNGMVFYLSTGEQSRMIDNLSWGNRATDFFFKAGGGHLAEGCAGPGGWRVNRNEVIRQSLAGNVTVTEDYINNIGGDELKDIDPHREFADPDNHDYRLQSTSRFRGAGENGADPGPYPYQEDIYYVSPDGDDTADGLSVENAWRSLHRAAEKLEAGDTLYVVAGVYLEDLTFHGGGDDPISIRGRGADSATIEGRVVIDQGINFEFKRLNFTGEVTVENSESVVLKNCRFDGDRLPLAARSVNGLRITHCEFGGSAHGALKLAESQRVFSRGNIFDNEDGPAVHLDTPDAFLYTDYNGYRMPDAAWTVDGQERGLEWVREIGHEHYSRAVGGDAAGPEALGGQVSHWAAGSGPLGKSLGVHRETLQADKPLRLAAPFIHSVTDTTANIEWWTSAPTGTHVLEWGKARDMDNSASVQAHRFGSFSLTGLEPETTYYLRMKSISPPEAGEDTEELFVAEEGEILSFTTESSAADPVTYYVAGDGDDAQSGRSRAEAWATVNYAAAQVRPGDTVLIAGGTYVESVRIRATGEKNRPITFRSKPGEKVIFDGDGRTLNYAFLASDKKNLHFDGFYFERFSMGGAVPWGDWRGHNGSVVLYRCEDVSITRCFHDSSGPGYGPGLLMAAHSKNVRLRNNVIAASMGGGISFWGCPDLRIENNVFLRNLIQNVSEGVNEPAQKFYMQNNIFTDNLASKVHGSMFGIGKIESLVERDNCYYLRIPSEERKMFTFYEHDPAYTRTARPWGLETDKTAFDQPPVVDEREQISLPEYQRRFNPESGSIAADPRFKGTLDMDRYDEEGEPVFLVDHLVRRLVQDDLDFPDLFASRPELTERSIGLQPDAFEDFHFNLHLEDNDQ